MKCIYCKSEIPEGASVCFICKNYQKMWKNFLPYVGAGIALLTFILSALLFIVTKGQELWKSITWKDDIRVLSFNSNGQSSLLNIGDGDVFVLRGECECPDLNYSFSWESYGHIKVGEPSTVTVHQADISFGEMSDKEIKALALQGPGAAGGAGVFAGGKLLPICFDKDSKYLHQLLTKLKLQVYSGTARIVFVSPKTGTEITKELPVTVAVANVK